MHSSRERYANDMQILTSVYGHSLTKCLFPRLIELNMIISLLLCFNAKYMISA